MKIPRSSLYSSIFGLTMAVIMALITSSVLAEMPQITNGRINQPPPGASVAAGYFTITNPGDSDLVITGASSKTIGRVEVHLSYVKDDVAFMRKQNEVVIEAGQTLSFEHGSFHLMLMEISTPLEAGQVIDVVLDTSSGPIPVKLPVASPGLKNRQQGNEKMAPMLHHNAEGGAMDHGNMKSN